MKDLTGKVAYIPGSIDKHMALEQIDAQERSEPYYKYRLINLKTLQVVEKWEGIIFKKRDKERFDTHSNYSR